MDGAMWINTSDGKLRAMVAGEPRDIAPVGKVRPYRRPTRREQEVYDALAEGEWERT